MPFSLQYVIKLKPPTVSQTSLQQDVNVEAVYLIQMGFIMSLQDKDIKRLQVAKVMCLNSILFHTKYFFKEQYNRKFIVNKHHELICSALERVLTGKCKRLIVNIAPRYSKTELAVKSLISHGLALNPKAKFIHLSYGDDIALDNSEAVKDLIQSSYYQQLFPEVKVKKDAKAKDKWYTTLGGGVLARSAAGQVTGFGAGQVDKPDASMDDDMDEFLNDIATAAETDFEAKFLFGGAIIIDDPIKPEDADQDTIREKINQRFDSTIRNRVNSRNTPIVVIMQRLHPRDLSGYLQRDGEQDEWEVLSLPCISETGDALWPFKHTIEELHKMKKSNELVFERQYMQNPKPKAGLMFPGDELNYYKPNSLEDHQYVYVAVDPANLGGDDFASAAAYLKDDKIHIHDVLYNTLGADANEPEVVNLAINNGANSVGVEGIMGWIESANRIREGLSKRGYKNELRVLRPRTAKHVRISARSSFIKNNFVFRSDYESNPQYAKFMRNLTSYKKIQEPGNMNKHDEAPDVCEMIANFYERQFPKIWSLT